MRFILLFDSKKTERLSKILEQLPMLKYFVVPNYFKVVIPQVIEKKDEYNEI